MPERNVHLGQWSEGMPTAGVAEKTTIGGCGKNAKTMLKKRGE